MIRPMTEKDVAPVVEMHMTLIKDALFPLLGQGFMEELYLGLLSSPQAICLVYEEDEVAGFIVGTYSSKGLFGSILRNRGIPLALKSLTFFLRHPSRWSSLLAILKYNRLTEIPGIEAEMPYIALRRTERGKGISKALVQEVLKGFQKKGITHVKVTAHQDNKGPNKLLQEMGFEMVRQFDFLGKRNNLYRGEIAHVLEIGGSEAQSGK